ncbi:MAG TPA: 4'-phosphopantetheinyl transferase superfamily protein [Anaerolineae bacterium]|nr:4'-phosphopantetheinyl transferase superfamily protein [Anaerolineae bacterium]
MHLEEHEIHLWRVPLNVDAAQQDTMHTQFSPDETERAARFHFERDRTRFIVAHAALRQILARYTRKNPNALSFRVGAYGKPTLAFETDIQFNLSHSGNLALIALTRGRAIGVDVESIRDNFDPLALATRFFSPPEIEDLRACDPATRTAQFFTLWTRKEAFIKAVGHGLSLSLSSFDISEVRGDRVRVLESRGDYEKTDWWVKTVLREQEYVGALAVEGEEPIVHWVQDY